MLAKRFSYTYIMKRQFLRHLFFFFNDTLLPENTSKSASFRSKGSEGSDAPSVPKRRGGHGGGGSRRGEGGGRFGPARSRTRPGPAPGPVWLFFCCAMAETPAVRRDSPVSSAAKVHNVLSNENQPTSQLWSVAFNNGE